MARANTNESGRGPRALSKNHTPTAAVTHASFASRKRGLPAIRATATPNSMIVSMKAPRRSIVRERITPPSVVTAGTTAPASSARYTLAPTALSP